jgi:hypothetical protein
MAALDELMQELRADGALDSEGRFTLDREQARAKMQKFQLADPRRYVLELVQAAVLRGAETIDFEIDADDMRVRFDGLAFTPAEIDDLYGSLFGDGNSREIRGVRQLALALNAALGMEPKFVHLRSGEVELRSRPGERDEIQTHEQAVPGTQIHVRQRVRPRLVLDFLRNLTGRLGEEQYLRDRCLYARAKIVLDGKRISEGLALCEPGLSSLPIEGEGFVGVMKLVTGGEDFTSLRLVKDGVWVDTRRLASCGTHILAVVEGEKLRKDVSQAKIVHDEALEAIIAAITTARWRLWTKARQGAEGEQAWKIDQWIRIQLLDYVGLDELARNLDALALAAQVRWPDCRGEGREIDLRTLVELARAGAPLRYGTHPYEELEPKGEPIPLLTEDEVERLARLLDSELVRADGFLERELLRLLGRKAWLERRGEPRLPTHLPYLVRAEFEHEGVRGEVGVDNHTLVATHLEHPVQANLYKDGCMLGRLELELGIPNLWLAIEAGFEPTDDYRDAVRDRSFADALLVGLAAFAGPFAEMLALAQGELGEDHARGLVKRWLIALIDRSAQVQLLVEAGVDVTPDFHRPVTELIPSLAYDELLVGSSSLAWSALFAQLDGPRVSLAQLAARHDEHGPLKYLPGAPRDERITAPDVVILGPGDRKIVRGLLGADSLEEFDTEPIVRRLRHLDQPQVDFSELHAELAVEAARTHLRPDEWLITLGAGVGGEPLGFLVPEYLDPEDLDQDALDATTVEVYRERRPLAELEVDLGWGPLIAIVNDDALTPDETWEGIVQDEAWDAAVERLREAADILFARLARHPTEFGSIRRWLTRVLLHAAARAAATGDRSRDQALREIRLFETVSGKTVGFAEIEAALAAHGQVEIVGRDTGWAPVSDPEVLQVEPDERAELEQLFGERFVDGSARVRHHRNFDKLESRPRMSEAVLADDTVLVRREVHGDDRRGEVGISSTRRSGGLHLRLGTVGFLVQELEEERGFHLPLEAVVIDDELPLDHEGEPDTKSKRYRRLLRQLRRSAPALISELVEGWEGLAAEQREQAWAVILPHLRHEAGEDRRSSREQAFAAASRVPGFVDLWGGHHHLAKIVARSRKRPAEVLFTLRPPAPERRAADELPVLLVNRAELECLRAHTKVEVLDDHWQQKQAWLARLADAPKVERPKIGEVAIAYRKAQVAGGLECELWIPRDYSALEPQGPPPELISTRDGREVGRLNLAGATPCAGFLRGELPSLGDGVIELDSRQEASLLRQVLILYIDMAEKLRAGALSSEDHERAIDYLAWVDLCFESGLDEFEGVGKRVGILRKLAAELVPPTLRESLRRSLELDDDEEKEEEDDDDGDDDGEVENDDDPTPSAEAEPPSPPEPAPAPKLETPEQRLLGALWDQLQWARAHHAEVLDELSLSRLQLIHTGASSIAELRFPGIAVNADHPLVTRLLEQDPHDLFDLSFVVAAIYTLMNHHAEEITDDHERQFVGQLAETLALTVRADRREPS